MNLDPTIVLYRGKHSADSGQMCALEAVAFVAGEPWSDHPACASEVIGTFLRSWNDSTSDVERQLLVPYIGRMVGTRAGAKIEQARSWMCADWLVRVHAPAWLDAAGLTEQANALRELPEIVGVATLNGAEPAIIDAKVCATTAWKVAPAARIALAWAEAEAAEAGAARAAWAAAWVARAWARDAACDAAWNAAGAAWNAARAAAPGTKAATKATLRDSAFALLDRMIALTDVSNGR